MRTLQTGALKSVQNQQIVAQHIFIDLDTVPSPFFGTTVTSSTQIFTEPVSDYVLNAFQL